MNTPVSAEHLLVVAQQAPRYDRNSGELRLFSLVRLLAERYRVSYLPVGLPPGSTRYVEELTSLGVTLVAPGTPLISLLRQDRVRAALLEYYHVAEYYLPRIRLLRPRCRLIVDTVDVHFIREDMEARLSGDPAGIVSAAQTKRRELHVYERADMVLTVTEDDKRALLAERPDIAVRVVPNVHELVPLDTLSDRPALIFVGAFSHKPNVDAMVYFCSEVLPRIRSRVEGVRLTIVGGDPPAAIRGLQSEMVTVCGFVPSTTPYLHASRVSVAPLRFGAGMKGKIGEAMAHGLPVVTTTVGAQGMGLEHRVNALIADGASAFAEAVIELLTDTQLADSIRKNAVEHVSRNFTSTRVGERMIDALEGLDALPLKGMSTIETMRFVGRWASDRVRR